MRRALALSALSALLPGSGHYLAGRRRLGAAIFVAFVLLVSVAVGLAVLVPRGQALRRLVRTDWLIGVMVGALGLALALSAVVISAYVTARRDPGASAGRHSAGAGAGGSRGFEGRALGAGLVALLCLVASTPLLVTARYAYVQHDLLTSVFQEDAPAPPVGGGAAAAGELRQQTRSDGGRDPWAERPRLNVLLLGGDGGANRTGVRTDSMTLASVDTHTGVTTLLSLPRNLEDAPFPPGPLRDRFPRGFFDLLNGVYRYGTDNPGLVPGARDPGAAAIKAAVSEVLGLPVDYYVLVNMDGFTGIVDALGGITVRVDAPLPIGGLAPDGRLTPVRRVVRPGVRKLSGYEALWYSRSRRNSNDYVRMGRQRCVLGAILHQADPVRVLTSFQRLAAATKDVVSTDIPRSLLPDLVDLTTRVRGARITSLQFVPPLIHTGNPDYDLIRRKAAEAIEAPAVTPSPRPSATPFPRPTSGPSASATGRPSRAGEAASLDEVCRYD